MIELKPCPMCGDTSIDYYYEDDSEVSVLCHHCRYETHVHRREKSAAREWNALPRRLKWTKEKPTQDGAYWYRRSAGEKLLAHIDDEMVMLLDMPGQEHVSFFDGEWAGPIPEPQESMS